MGSRSALPPIGPISVRTPPPRLNVTSLRVLTGGGTQGHPSSSGSTAFRDAPEFGVPKTPVNTRSMQRTDLHAAVLAMNIPAVKALLAGRRPGVTGTRHTVSTSSSSSSTPQRNFGAGASGGSGGGAAAGSASASAPSSAAPPAAAGAAAAAAMPAPTPLPSCRGNVDVQEENGWTPLIQAVALGADSGVEVARVLLDHKAKVGICGKDGFSTMHWAAACGNVGCIELLVQRGGDVNCPSTFPVGPTARSAAARRSVGETPLHRAARLGAVSCVQKLLQLGANIDARSAFRETALDVAGEYNTRVNPDVRLLVRKVFLEYKPTLKTLVLHHDDCLQHLTPREHQEAPGRLTAVMDAITDPARFHPWELTVSDSFERCSWPQVVRVHAKSYVMMVRKLDYEVAQNLDGDEPVPFTPHVQRSIGMSERRIKSPGTSDTAFSKGSLGAALRAGGAVCRAVDAVVNGENRNAFCVVRPPGHHAGVNGLEDGAHSCGFCIFNSVAIGAMHALDRHRGNGVERVAIVDFDIHHGNGTEEIVKDLASKGIAEDRILFFSIHLFDKGDGNYHFYPGTGSDDHIGSNVINEPLTPLWNQERQSTRRKSYTELGRMRWRRMMMRRLLPALRAFRPSLIMVSAGFDGAAFDVGNIKLDSAERGKWEHGIDLRPEDFEWFTRQLLKVASITCNGRVVSVLEGGYGAHRTRGARSSSACCVDSDGGSSAGSGRRRTRRKRSRASPSDADGSSSDRSSSRGGGSVPPAELASTSAAVKQPVVVAAAAAAAAQGKGKRKGKGKAVVPPSPPAIASPSTAAALMKNAKSKIQSKAIAKSPAEARAAEELRRSFANSGSAGAGADAREGGALSTDSTASRSSTAVTDEEDFSLDLSVLANAASGHLVGLLSR